MSIAALAGASVPERFAPALRAVEGLAAADRYVGALIFGSIAQDNANDASDLDVRVLVGNDNPCSAINHPRIGGVKLDITFCSVEQLERQLDDEIADGRRAPMIADAVILFDKTGPSSCSTTPTTRWSVRSTTIRPRRCGRCTRP